MDLDEVKVCIRALLSSSAFSYYLKDLLNDFRSMTGFDLPLFGYLHPVEFLKTLNDTVQLFGNSYNPEIALIESKKSSHITSLVDRQKTNSLKTKYSHILTKPKRLILSDKKETETDLKEDKFIRSELSFRNTKENELISRAKESEPKFNSYPSTNGSNQPQVIKPLLDIKVDPTVLFRTNNYSNYSSCSIPRNYERNIEVKKSPVEFFENDKTDSCYFEDVSDNESVLSIEESKNSSIEAVSASCCSVNDGIKNKLKKLIKNYPKGLWCCELPELFLKEYNFVLDSREFGYTSMIQMLSELPDVFRCVRPGNEDWILFDASVPLSSEEKKMMNLQLTGDINCEIRANIQKLMLNYLENSSDSAIEMDKILDLYQKMFGNHLDYQSLGFKDVKSLLETWEGSLLNLLKISGKIFVVPVSKITCINSPKLWEEAVPPITAENDIFAEIFPKEVIGPDERLLELDLTRHVAVDHVIEVCIAEVWSPSKFYLQINKFKNRLNRFMDDLQKFYNIHLGKYKMPESTIRPNQICVGLYASDPDLPEEWHRAQIIKVINEKFVLVNFVDFGTVARLKKSQLRFLHRSFQSFPIQAFLAELSGVVPPKNEKEWPISTSKKFLELLRVPYLEAKMIDIDFKKPSMSVVLFDPFHKLEANINKKLIVEKLAWVKESVLDSSHLFSERKSEVEEEDSKLPKNQGKAFSDNSLDVAIPENLNKNEPQLTDDFSDIPDLGHTTLLHFKMKCLKLEESLHSKEKDEASKPAENLKVLDEFEEISDLEKNIEEKNDAVKETAKDNVFENKNLKLTSPIRDTQDRSPQLIKKESNLIFPPANMMAPEQPSLPLMGISKRLPPGLEHVNILPSFNEISLLAQPEDKRKKINILAIELLTTNLNIKQIGVNDPVLALKIATEMAEAYINSDYSSKLSCFNPQLPSSFVDGEVFQNGYLETEPVVPPFVPASPGVPFEPMLKPQETTNFVTYTANTNFPRCDSSQASSSKATTKATTVREKKENEYVKSIQICGKNLHLLTIDGQYYFCAEEIVRNFTLISNREIADRVLHIKKISINYKIITKKSDEKALNAIKSSDLATSKKKSKKLKIYLIPLPKVVPFLQALGCKTESFENTFLELQSKNDKKLTNPKVAEFS